jgi:hypothetical protein
MAVTSAQFAASIKLVEVSLLTAIKPTFLETMRANYTGLD